MCARVTFELCIDFHFPNIKTVSKSTHLFIAEIDDRFSGNLTQENGDRLFILQARMTYVILATKYLNALHIKLPKAVLFQHIYLYIYTYIFLRLLQFISQSHPS